LTPNTQEQSGATTPIDHVAGLLGTVAPGKNVDRARLQEDIRLCASLERGIVPLALIIGATASLDREHVRAFVTRLPKALPDDVLEDLDLVSETLLMVADKDLQASGTVAASLLMQRSLPASLPARDSVLHELLDVLEDQYQDRLLRHGEVFGCFSRVGDSTTLRDLPALLRDVSDAVENVACDMDAFLDNPIELVEHGDTAAGTSEEAFKRSRIRSNADLPALSEELEQIAAFATLLGWPPDRGFEFATDLYERGVIDSRSKIGLQIAAISTLATELNEALETRVADVEINDQGDVTAPYDYDPDRGTLKLNVQFRGGLTGRLLRAEHAATLEQLLQSEADREAARLEAATERYREARGRIQRDLGSEEEEWAALQAIAATLGLNEMGTYDWATALYGNERLSFSIDPQEGLSVHTLRELLETVSKHGPASTIEIDADADHLVPISFDAESGVLRIHAAFDRLSAAAIQRFLAARTLEPQPLAAPDEAVLAEYVDPDKPGSLANTKNVARFIKEFGLDDEFAQVSFEVLLEGCAGFQEKISLQTLRVLVATMNERRAALGGPTIDLVTGCFRDTPGTEELDRSSPAWLEVHDEDEVVLQMLAFNFHYGEGKKLPPFSDELLLTWCRHFRVS